MDATTVEQARLAKALHARLTAIHDAHVSHTRHACRVEPTDPWVPALRQGWETEAVQEFMQAMRKADSADALRKERNEQLEMERWNGDHALTGPDPEYYRDPY